MQNVVSYIELSFKKFPSCVIAFHSFFQFCSSSFFQLHGLANLSGTAENLYLEEKNIFQKDFWLFSNPLFTLSSAKARLPTTSLIYMQNCRNCRICSLSQNSRIYSGMNLSQISLKKNGQCFFIRNRQL